MYADFGLTVTETIEPTAECTEIEQMVCERGRRYIQDLLAAGETYTKVEFAFLCAHTASLIKPSNHMYTEPGSVEWKIQK